MGVIGHHETVFDKPMTPAEIQSVMYSTIQPHNIIQAVLQQEILLYCGRLIGTNPEMFKGILKIRIGYKDIYIYTHTHIIFFPRLYKILLHA